MRNVAYNIAYGRVHKGGGDVRAQAAEDPKRSPDGMSKRLEDSGTINAADTEIASSVGLQMLLYFNVVYSLTWFPACLISTAIKGSSDLVRAALLLVFLIAEPLRLCIGYSGNLQEKVPVVTAFMLLTLFPALPVCGYFTVVQKEVQPYDKAMGTVMGVFLIVELLASYRAVRRIIKSQTLKFYLEDYEEIRERLKHGLKVDI